MFYIFENVGPLLIMIFEMLKDLLYFLLIIVVCIIGYGVISTALRFPHAKLDEDLIKKIFYQPYFNLYAELFLENFDVEFNKRCNETLFGDNPCPRTSVFSFFVFIIFLLFGNVLMLNLLIAKFSDSFARISKESELYHSFLMFDIVKEYIHRPLLFSPFSIIFFFLQICKIYSPEDKLEPLSEDKITRDLIDFENIGKFLYLNESEKSFDLMQNNVKENNSKEN